MDIGPLEPAQLAEARELLVGALTWDPFVAIVAEEKLFGGNAGRKGVTLAAREAGQLIGVIAAAGRWIKLLAVAPAARRKGVATALLAQIEGAKLRLGDHPGNYLTPGVDPRYLEGIAFLRARGFQPAGEAPNLRVPLVGNKRTTRVHAERLEAGCPGYRVRRALASDAEALEKMVTAAFSRAQAYEIGRALEVGGVHMALARDSGDIVAFAAHDGNNRGLGWFGPAGTHPDHRGKGIGECLLVHCLADVAERGQDETIVAWVGPVDFYRRAVGATVERTFTQWERP